MGYYCSVFKDMRKYKYSKRELLNAVLYVINNGCKPSC